MTATASNGVPLLHPTFTRILYLCAISVTLAVSLNLVNGFTGQFSIGHAGFMAVGAYAGAAITHVFPAMQSQFGLLIATLFGAGVAGLFGYGVGVPSLRLRGDYLAIVTLGFGEIIRVFLANTDKIPGLNFMGGSLGMSNIPPLSNFFWTIGVGDTRDCRLPKSQAKSARSRVSFRCVKTRSPRTRWASTPRKSR